MAKIKVYAGVYDELEQIVGTEALEAIYKNMAGRQVTFPVRLYSTEYILSQAMEAKDNNEIRHMAVKFGYTEQRLKQLMKTKDNVS